MRTRAVPILALLLLLGAPAAAQSEPAELAALEERTYARKLSEVTPGDLPELLSEAARAEALAGAGVDGPRAAHLIRYLAVLRQLAQLQDPDRVRFRDADGDPIGPRNKDIKRLRRTLKELRAEPPTGPVPGVEVAPAEGPPRLLDRLNRELGVLEFNERILANAADAEVPPLERLRFLTIASGNLDEFFELRVAGLKEEVAQDPSTTRSGGYTAEETLAQIVRQSRALVAEQYRLLNESVLPALEGERIGLSSLGDASADVQRWAAERFDQELAPELRVLPLADGQPFPHLTGRSTHLLVTLASGGRAVVVLPPGTPASAALPTELAGGGQRFVLTSELVARNVAKLFPGQGVEDVAPFRLSRNSDVVGRSGMPRRYGDAVRLEMESGASPAARAFLLDATGLTASDLYLSRGPVDLKRLGEVVNVDRPDLVWDRVEAGRPERLPEGASVFEALREGDVLMHHPFQAYDPVVEMLEEAARDPGVQSVRQTLYRVGGPSSSITAALLEAVRNGKKVTVIVEGRARFDEANNVELLRQLEEAGAKVRYGPPGLKVHAKMLEVKRLEGGKLRRYVHLATGNYNPSKAKLYTDFSLMTADKALTKDVGKILDQLSGKGPDGPLELKKLLQAPYDLRSTLLERIAAEAAAAKAGQPARITAKMNSLADPKLIKALYEASQAGVQIDLIVRGLSTLRPGVPGLSENIRVRSVVGRYLEHSRVFEFHNGGEPKLYLSSADWMTRNTTKRVEVAFPVEDPALKAEISETLQSYLQDNTRAWRLRSDGRYERVARPSSPAALRDVHRELIARYAGEDLAPLPGAREAEAARRLEPYRRPDRTIDWKRARAGLAREGAGLAHFGLALFLKELAVVAETGDRERIEEFFDGLLTTDFYTQYGLFMAGSRLADVAYVKYLQRHIRPGFVNGVLRTNLVLAAGLALPQIAEGTFNGKVFAISLASLGLSSAAVKGTISGIKWVTRLEDARSTGALRGLARTGRLANVAGWVYSAAELAVVLYVAEKVETEAHRRLARKAQLDALADAGEALIAASRAADATPASLERAAQTFHEAWTRYREELYEPLHQEEARFAKRLEGYAHDAKLVSDRRAAAAARLGDEGALAGALERYDARRQAEQEALGEALAGSLQDYDRRRAAALEEVYAGNLRDGAYLTADVRGRLIGTEPAPASLGWADRLRELVHQRAQRSALRRASPNRLQSYDDELELLAAVAASLRLRDRTDLARALAPVQALTARTQAMDRALFEGGAAEATGRGMIEALEAATAGDGD